MNHSKLTMLALAAVAFFAYARKGSATAVDAGSAAHTTGTAPGAAYTAPNDFPNIGTMPFKIPADFGVIDPAAGW